MKYNFNNITEGAIILSNDSNLLCSIENVINTTIRPSLNADGGDISIISLEGNLLTVKLQGACGCCPRAQETLKYGVERTLRMSVSDKIVVQAI